MKLIADRGVTRESVKNKTDRSLIVSIFRGNLLKSLVIVSEDFNGESDYC